MNLGDAERLRLVLMYAACLFPRSHGQVLHEYSVAAESDLP